MHTTITTIFNSNGAVMNRGRDGQPKTLADGRQYVSSQAFRAAMRDQIVAPLSEIETTGTVRSRVALIRALTEAGIPSEIAVAVQKEVLGLKGDGESESDGDDASSAPVTLGNVEISATVSLAKEIDLSFETEEDTKKRKAALERAVKAAMKDLRKLLQPASAGVEACLFGRMITGDALHRVDGILSTSLAISTTVTPTVQDFFVARDQLVSAGTAHMNTRPISTGVYMQETVIDAGRMAAQLPEEDHRSLVAWVIRACAFAPTKLARAGSSPLAPAAEVIVTPSPLPRSALSAVNESPASVQDAANAALAQLAEQDRIYGDAKHYQMTELGLEGLIATVTGVLQSSGASS
ncbi:MAG: type I-E CRISPR-associated protein Cas7/Cse4/CasC [Paracoccaceae bacterium]